MPHGREILSAERSWSGFVLHLSAGTARVIVRKRERRDVERALRSLGVTIVDEWGARIDGSQFTKEADPTFNRKVGPGLFRFLLKAFAPLPVVNWLHRRRVRQSSDDA